MHTLVVTSHPEPASLTHAIAKQVMAGIGTDPSHTVEMADLAAEGFDPRFTSMDHELFLRRGAADPAILAEQRRLDRADVLVLVFPVYWWAMPGLLKGWIDRVFAQGWAYEELPDGRLIKRLGRLAVQLIAIGAAGPGTYARHGYSQAMRTQIDHGIFGYCGARVIGSEIMMLPDPRAREDALRRAFTIGRELVRASGCDVMPATTVS